MAIRVLTSLLRRRQVRWHSSGSKATQSNVSWGLASISEEQQQQQQQRRRNGCAPSAMIKHHCFSTLSEQEHNKELDDINSKFAEAREEIELALESKETVYFNEEAETARVAVQAVLDKYQALLAKLGEQQKGVVQRSMGMKMEQLKAELAQLKED